MVLLGFIYFAVVAFIVLSVQKFVQFARMPMHGRWELYPVPKEGEKSHYGGSYYEEPEWWKKPRKTSHVTEIKEMLKEMLFIKNLFVNNRKQWLVSYPMHLAFYLLGLWVVLLAAGAVTELSGVSLAAAEAAPVKFLYFLILVTGAAGLVLLTAGSTGLLWRRIFNDEYRKYTTPQEYFNLLFLMAVAISGVVAWTGDVTFGYALELMKSVLTASPVTAGTALTVHIILAAAILVYIPQTKMSHYVGKYFSFHKVLWENEPNLKNSKIEQMVRETMNKKPGTTWSAPHINPDSSKSQTR